MCRNWTVRSQLATIVVVITVLFVGVGGFLSHEMWRNAQQAARAEAADVAEFGAQAVSENAALAKDQAVQIAANPGVVKPFSDSSGCSLDFSLALFPGAHLDLVRPNGDVVCSSADLGAGRATQAGAVWLDVRGREPGAVSDIFTDRVSGLPAVAFVAPVEQEGTEIGLVAVVVPTGQIAQMISDQYGGSRQYHFLLVDADAEVVLSSSGATGPGAPAVGSKASEPMRGLLSGSHPTANFGWVLFSGADPDSALAPTRSLLLRGTLLAACVLVVLIGSMMLVNRRIARPLRTLTRSIAGAGSRTGITLPTIDGPAEVQQLAAEFQSTISSRDEYESQLSHLAFHDPLTGLANRALLIERLGDSLERSLRSQSHVAVLFIDVDQFKLVNDSLGHESGDAVLIELARRVLDLLPAGGSLARFGGDEFVAIVESSDDRQLERLTDELLAGIVAPIDVGTAVVRVSASIGIATNTVGQRAVELIRDADNAMYAAKERGRGRAERFTSQLHDRASTHLTLATELRVALDRNELHVAYQPKIDLGTGDIIGVEALIRWNHPALGAVPPSTFIPIAEETDVILRIGEFVLEEACRQTMEWREAGVHLTVAVNVSGRQLSDGALPLQVATALALSGLPPGSLYLELTETLLMTDTLANERSLQRLDAMGVRISIDDFGTGYSSLAYLHRFPVHELKIDRSFISELATTTHRAPLVSAMIAMGSALGIEIVAEGVETADQAALLRLLGCNRAQGFLFGAPQSPDTIVALATSSRPRV